MLRIVSLELENQTLLLAIIRTTERSIWPLGKGWPWDFQPLSVWRSGMHRCVTGGAMRVRAKHVEGRSKSPATMPQNQQTKRPKATAQKQRSLSVGWPESLLTSCVPDLELHCFPTSIDHLRAKLHANGVVRILLDYIHAKVESGCSSELSSTAGTDTYTFPQWTGEEYRIFPHRRFQSPRIWTRSLQGRSIEQKVTAPAP